MTVSARTPYAVAFGAMVNVGDVEPVKPMWAAEMMAEVHRKASFFMGKKLDDRVPVQILAMAKELILEQVRMRGLNTTGDFNWMDVDIDPSNPCSVRIRVRHGVLEQLDADLQNRECGRCGSLLTYGFRHTPDQCDESLVLDVLDS